MATYLLTVQRAERTDQGLRLSPGIRLSQTKDRPAICKMSQGSRLEMRRADGARRLTRLVNYGVSVIRGADGSFSMNEDPTDPEIKLTLPEDLSPQDVAAGTEVWLLDPLDG
jgi:hypothetical protein